MSVNFTPKADIDGNGNAGFEYQDPNVTGATVTYKFDASFELIGNRSLMIMVMCFRNSNRQRGWHLHRCRELNLLIAVMTHAHILLFTIQPMIRSPVAQRQSMATRKTYNSSWAVTSETRDTSALGTALTDAQLTGVPESLKSTQSDGDTYSSVETFTGGTETTFYDSTGAILGYASTSTQTDGGNTYTSTFYSDASWEFAGNSWSDPYGSGSTSRVKKTDTNGDYVSANDPYFEEVGTSSWTNADGQTETRDYTYRFEVDTNGDMGNFLGGTETVDGATITFNSDWSIAGRAKQVDSNATALTQAQLDAIPDALETTLNDGLTYADAETYDWGTETTYYDSAGTVLGYSSVNTWSYDDGSGNTISGTNTNFNDANWNHLGSSWSDAYGSGSMIVTTGTDDGSGTLTGVANQKYRKKLMSLRIQMEILRPELTTSMMMRVILVAQMPMQLMPRIQALAIS